MFQARLELSETAKPDSASTIKLIIVEKHAAVRRALRKRLDAVPNLKVVAALPEPNAALPYLNPSGTPDDCLDTPEVVLLGLHNGPDEELFDTLHVIQQMVRSPAAVIVLAPYADEVERILMQQAGVSRYLLKYIDSHQLIHEIESAAHRGRDPVANS
jgi:DNA-binding NarL/FixJ family response regulator